MKRYTGTKTVMAEPMDEREAIAHCFARPNTDNHPYRNGFHIQYTNPDGSLYDSWSPEDVFLQAYNISDTYVDRICLEALQLCKKIDLLSDFLKAESPLSFIETHLLKTQLTIMKSYFNILQARLSLIDDDPSPDTDSPQPINSVKTSRHD